MPVLYSFRRCPYAIRARMALLYAGIDVELREVLLKDKPRHMLELSAKGTVPVLQLAGQVLDESWDILCWATAQRDSDAWRGVDDCHLPASKALVREVDESFKPWLDKYKYIVPETAHLQASYRAACGRFLAGLESRLITRRFFSMIIGPWPISALSLLSDSLPVSIRPGFPNRRIGASTNG